MKERVTLTIEGELLEKVDAMIDSVMVKNRSHAFELLLRKALKSNKLSLAVILAGGKAKTPRCMVKVGGKPLLQHNLELLKRYGVEEVVMCVDKKSSVIKDYFKDGSELGLSIRYVEEKTPLGTAGPLNLAKRFVKETFVMMNADEYKDIDLEDMYRFHKEHDAFATIALTTVSDPSRYGVALLNGNKITTFIEKPDAGNAPSNLINAGLYIFEPGVIELVPEGFSTLENDVFPKLAREEKLYGYPFSGKWFDMNLVARYKVKLREKPGFLTE